MTREKGYLGEASRPEDDRKMTRSYSVLIATRNESARISAAIASLRNQTAPPQRIVVVDASTDDTASIARELGADVYQLPFGPSQLGRPEFAETINVGLEHLSADPVDYVLNLDADTLLPPHYMETIMTRMDDDPSLGICSGRKPGDRSSPEIPRHSMMVVRSAVWKLVGWRYPVVWGYELWLQEKARSLGFQLRCFPDIEVGSLRKTDIGKGTNDGKAMYALGYPPAYAIGRSALLFVHSPTAGLKMLYGYLTHEGVEPANTPMDIRERVNRWSSERMRRYTPWFLLALLVAVFFAGLTALILR